jgi:hypothetical protein
LKAWSSPRSNGSTGSIIDDCSSQLALPPAEFEAAFYQQLEESAMAA